MRDPIYISLLGATGSVGQSCLDLVRRNPERFQIAVLTAHNKLDELVQLAMEFKPQLVAIGNEALYAPLCERLKGFDIKIAAGRAGLVEAGEFPSDMVVAAIVGTAGLRPTMAAVRRGATVALANKECLVCAGDMMMREAAKSGAEILPVDSEHNAIFQVFDFKRPELVEKLTLTASGGPFLKRKLQSLYDVSVAEAVAHPNWSMGAKISVDCATMMNKGLEAIEAFHLFPVSSHQIDIVIHPQSIIHSLVHYKDASVLAQLGSPDMRIPLAYCMAWPERLVTPVKRLNLAEIARLDFFEPDLVQFPCLALALQAMHEGGNAPLILNAANEIAVAHFLNGQIGFMDIAKLVEKALTAFSDTKRPHSLASLLETDENIRQMVAETLVPSLRTESKIYYKN